MKIFRPICFDLANETKLNGRVRIHLFNGNSYRVCISFQQFMKVAT